MTPDLESLRIDPLKWASLDRRGEESLLGAPPESWNMTPMAHSCGRFRCRTGFTSARTFTGTASEISRSRVTCFAADGESLWISLEGPLLQDGESPDQ